MTRKKTFFGVKKKKRSKKPALESKLEDLKSKFRLKELSIILYDIVANNTILSGQKPFISRNVDSIDVIDKCAQYKKGEINLEEEKHLDNSSLYSKHSNSKSTTIKEKSVLNRNKKKKQNKDNKKVMLKKDNVNTELLRVEKTNNNIQGEECEVKNKSMGKQDNIDLLIDAKSSNRDLSFDLLNQTIPISSTRTENTTRNQDLHFNENFQTSLIKSTSLTEEKPSVLKALLLSTMPVKVEGRNLPKIKEDNVLPSKTIKVSTHKCKKKNYVKPSVPSTNLSNIKENNPLPKNKALLSKPQNDMQIPKNLQDMVSSTNEVLHKQNDKLSVVESHGEAAKLTVDNLYKFTEKCDKYLMTAENDLSLNATQHSSNSMMRTRRRSWIMQAEETQLNKTGVKRIKLNRQCIHDNNANICDSTATKNMDNRSILSSKNGNALCNIQFLQESTKADSNIILRSTDAVENNISSSSCKENELSVKPNSSVRENISQNNLSKSKTLEDDMHDNHDNDIDDDSYEDDCISLFTDSFKSLDEIISPRNNKTRKLPEVLCKTEQNKTTQDYKTIEDKNNNTNQDSEMLKDKQNNTNQNCKKIEDKQNITNQDGKMIDDKSNTTNQDYKMTGNTLNNYLKQNILECNKAFGTIMEYDTQQNRSYLKSCQEKYEDTQRISMSPISKTSINVEDSSSVNFNVINNNNNLCFDKNYIEYTEDIVSSIETVATYDAKMNPMNYKKWYKGYCYAILKHGDCSKMHCYYNHDLSTLLRNVFKYKMYLTDIIDYTYSAKYHYLVESIYLQSLQECNVAFIINTYQKLYSRKYPHSEIIYSTVETLLEKGVNVKDVVDSLCKVLDPVDRNTPQYILLSIKSKIKAGEYWNTLRNLVVYINPKKEVIESILIDCLMTRKHVLDIYENLIKQLHPNEINRLNNKIMLSFNNLLVDEYQKSSITVSSESVINNKESCEGSYSVDVISDLPKPHSLYRDRFWKIYLMLYNIKEGLLHEDYDYVIRILDEYEEKSEDESLFSRCCFRMLCAEIKHSEYHVSKIIEHAVRIGASGILYKILLDTATYVLVQLITEEAWTLAYKLLKNLQTYNLQHSAAFIILSAEVYLANRHAVKALMLIKKSNIISLNRKNWNVISNAEDSHLRTNLIRMLLDVLCIESLEHAFFMFEFLVKDQASNFQPIDLTHYVDKLMLKFLIEREIELIIKMTHMIMEYNFTFFDSTIYRAAITTLVHNDMTLAKQLYQYASGLGIYSTIVALPVTNVMINTELVEEEIYLIFSNLFQKLIMEIGHSIDRFKYTLLSIYIIFKSVPTDVNLYNENFDDKQVEKIKISKSLVREVLRKRFEPPIPLSRNVNENVMKLQKKAVIDYLKSLSER